MITRQVIASKTRTLRYVQRKANERTKYASNCQADVKNFRKTLKMQPVSIMSTIVIYIYIYIYIYTNALVHGSKICISQW